MSVNIDDIIREMERMAGITHSDVPVTEVHPSTSPEHSSDENQNLEEQPLVDSPESTTIDTSFGSLEIPNSHDFEYPRTFPQNFSDIATLEELRRVSELIHEAATPSTTSEEADAESTTQEDSTIEVVDNRIQLNSNTVTIKESTVRFSDAIWFKKIQEKVIILAGVGGIGSWTAMLLARMQVKSIMLYDDDTVEAVNMAGQLYSSYDIGLNKATAISKTIESYCAFNSVFAVISKFTEESEAGDIMICGFDNMEARKTFFYKWKEHVYSKEPQNRAKCLFIDGRLDAESLQVLCIRGDDDFNTTRYETEFLFDDYQAAITVCSYKQTSFMANMIASVIVNLFTNFCAIEAGSYRVLPFFTEFTAETMNFKMEN